MGILKTITNELRRVQAERELQDLLEVLRRRIDVITFGELAGLVTSALGKKLAAVKVSAILRAPTEGDGASPPPSPAAGAAASSKKRTPAKKPHSKKSTHKSKAKAAPASKRKARASAATSKAESKPTRRSATTKATKRTPQNRGPTVARAPVAPSAEQEQAVLRALGAHAAPLGIRSVLGAAGLTLSQANRTLRRLTAEGKVRMIGPKQRATYALAQGPGPDEVGTSLAPASTELATTATSTTGETRPSRDAYDEAILAATRDAGDWIGAAALREKVGGTSEQLRLALVHLVAAGILKRTGERNKTRYNLSG